MMQLSCSVEKDSCFINSNSCKAKAIYEMIEAKLYMMLNTNKPAYMLKEEEEGKEENSGHLENDARQQSLRGGQKRDLQLVDICTACFATESAIVCYAIGCPLNGGQRLQG